MLPIVYLFKRGTLRPNVETVAKRNSVKLLDLEALVRLIM